MKFHAVVIILCAVVSVHADVNENDQRALLKARVSDALKLKDVERLAHMSVEEIQQLDLGEVARLLHVEEWNIKDAFSKAGNWIKKTASNAFQKVKEVGEKIVKGVEKKMCNGGNCWAHWGKSLLKHGAEFVKNAATCSVKGGLGGGDSKDKSAKTKMKAFGDKVGNCLKSSLKETAKDVKKDVVEKGKKVMDIACDEVGESTNAMVGNACDKLKEKISDLADKHLLKTEAAIDSKNETDAVDDIVSAGSSTNEDDVANEQLEGGGIASTVDEAKAKIAEELNNEGVDGDEIVSETPDDVVDESKAGETDASAATPDASKTDASTATPDVSETDAPAATPDVSETDAPEKIGEKIEETDNPAATQDAPSDASEEIKKIEKKIEETDNSADTLDVPDSAPADASKIERMDVAPKAKPHQARERNAPLAPETVPQQEDDATGNPARFRLRGEHKPPSDAKEQRNVINIYLD